MDEKNLTDQPVAPGHNQPQPSPANQSGQPFSPNTPEQPSKTNSQPPSWPSHPGHLGAPAQPSQPAPVNQPGQEAFNRISQMINQPNRPGVPATSTPPATTPLSGQVSPAVVNQPANHLRAGPHNNQAFKPPETQQPPSQPTAPLNRPTNPTSANNHLAANPAMAPASHLPQNQQAKNPVINRAPAAGQPATAGPKNQSANLVGQPQRPLQPAATTSSQKPSKPSANNKDVVVGATKNTATSAARVNQFIPQINQTAVLPTNTQIVAASRQKIVGGMGKYTSWIALACASTLVGVLVTLVVIALNA